MIIDRKIIGFLCLLLTLVSLGQINAYSQEDKVEVEISTNKVIIDGVVYYLHMVKSGQTLYSICKAYNVSENEVI